VAVTRKRGTTTKVDDALAALRPFSRKAEARTVAGEKRIVITATSATAIAAKLSQARRMQQRLKETDRERDDAEAKAEVASRRAENLETILRNHGIDVPQDPESQPEPKGGWLHRMGGSFEGGKRHR
jgi:hypothetical protein